MHQIFYPDLKEWHGDQKPSEYDVLSTVGEITFISMQLYENKTAFFHADTDNTVTFRELRAKSVRVALNLRRIGIAQGDTVCILSSFNEHVDSVVLGCAFLAAPFAILDPEADTERILHYLGIYEPKLVVCLDKLEVAVREFLGEETKIVTFDHFEELLKAVEGEELFSPISQVPESEPFCYSLTSGTTGNPKAAMISHAIFISQALSDISWPPGTVLLRFAPLMWITSIYTIFQSCVNGLSRVITTQDFSPEHQAELVQKYKVTVIDSCSPLQIAMILDYGKSNFSTIRQFGSGGTMLQKELAGRLKDMLPNGIVYNCYGMTETLVTAVNYTQDKLPSIGQPIFRTKFKIVDDLGKRLDPNETGEVCVKTPIRFMGYLKSPSESEQIYDSEGWIKTGDMGHFDIDGFLFIEGRLKDMIRIRHPTQRRLYSICGSVIENVIIKETGLMRVCVVAVEDGKYRHHELPGAAIIKPEGNPITEGDIVRIVTKKLGPSYIEGGVYFVDSFPQTKVGKIKRFELKKVIQKLFFRRQLGFKT